MPTIEEGEEAVMTPPEAAGVPTRHGTPAPVVPEGARAIDAAQILCGSNEVVIRHAGQAYRLRVTRTNKLLLIK